MVTDIYEKINEWMGAHFAWAQAHPKYGLLFASGLLALWLTVVAAMEMGMRMAVQPCQDLDV